MGSIQTVLEIAILLGLMIQDCCENCDFRIFSSPSQSSKGRCDLSVPLESNTILNNVARVIKYSETLGGGTDFPYDYIEDLIRQRKVINTFIILSDMMIAPGKSEMEARGTDVTRILKDYRTKINPNLLFVAIDLYGNGKSIVDINTDNPLNVLITGFSDNILRFISERGGEKQFDYVQNIDKIKLNKTGKNKGKKEELKEEVMDM